MKGLLRVVCSFSCVLLIMLTTNLPVESNCRSGDLIPVVFIVGEFMTTMVDDDFYTSEIGGNDNSYGQFNSIGRPGLTYGDEVIQGFRPIYIPIPHDRCLFCHPPNRCLFYHPINPPIEPPVRFDPFSIFN
ncbi:MAG: hypothetical protein HY606_01115 [Planctomycetes bacterium]|nr:hypothetical protein [Planctomycetota bacterium]